MKEDNIEYDLSCIAANTPDRRERIATAALQGMLADPDREGTPNDYAYAAVLCADALIAELDKDIK